MSVVVTVMNMKGGVGKTTACMHLASAAAALRLSRPLKVLVIDYDPQFNLSQSLLPSKKYFELEKAKKTILSVLVEDDVSLDPYKIQTPGSSIPPGVNEINESVLKFNDGSRLDIVPSTLNLMYVALGQATGSTKPIEERFEKFIADCRSKYDLIFIDCHPAGSVFTKTSLRNSDHVLIPVAPQRYSVRGIGLMMEFISSRKQGASDPIPHILFNLTSRTSILPEEASIRANPKYSKYCMSTSLKKFGAFAELDEGKGYVWVSTKPYSTIAWHNLRAVTLEFLERVGIS